MTTRDEARERLAAALAMADRYGIGGVQFGEGPDGEVNFDHVRALLSDQPRPSVSEDQGASRPDGRTTGRDLVTTAELILSAIERVPRWMDSVDLITARAHAHVLHEDLPFALATTGKGGE